MKFALLVASLPLLQVIAKDLGSNLRKKATTRRLRKTDAFNDLADPNGDVIIEFDEECTYEQLKNALLTRCPECNPDKDIPRAHLFVNLCRKAHRQFGKLEEDGGSAYPFHDISERGYQFDNEYYNGGTFLNTEYENVDIRDKAPFVDTKYEEVAEQRLLEFPETYIKNNFHKCQAQTVMCCWVQDRQADNDGNCAENNCEDKDPADNTEICAVDLHKAKRNNHVSGGFALFQGDTAGDAHCHGFSWSNNTSDESYQYRGNNLFYVSMYDHLNVRGYVREVPGAPMCSCLEKMPVVSRADCTEVTVNEGYVFKYNVNDRSKSLIITDTEVEFNACTNNDLRTRFDELDADNLISPGVKSIFDNQVPQSGCSDATYNNFLSTFGYKLA